MLCFVGFKYLRCYGICICMMLRIQVPILAADPNIAVVFGLISCLLLVVLGARTFFLPESIQV